MADADAPSGLLCVAGGLLILTLWGEGAAAGTEPAGTPPATVIATVSGQPITAEEIVASHKETFDKLAAVRDQRARQLQLEYERIYHDSLQKELDAVLDKRALELEARSHKSSATALLAKIKVPPVTDAEARAFFEAHKAQTSQSYAQLETTIRQHLAEQHSEAVTQAFYAELRKKHAITSLLEPYRVAVDATGPARGPVDARVTIVEFGDFQCPYCRKVESSLNAVLEKHPNDVRLVFRNLPLTDLHPDAALAARAGICADDQGKFWQMHDAMFGDQTALAAPGLLATATRLGLDQARFSSCLNDAAAAARILDVDAQTAAELAINGTPYFFIDGIPLSGTASPEQFEQIIADELSRARRGS
jgi:protein-disulfide isomerase